MAKAIDWHYHRKNCTSCGKAQEFLDANAIPPAPERTDARKVRYDRAEAIALARKAHRVVVAKGKKVVVLDLKTGAVDDNTLAGHLLGPTGTMRAPALRVGATLYIGFNEEAYADLMA